jgi:putative ABC transport system ATP-binding protein
MRNALRKREGAAAVLELQDIYKTYDANLPTRTELFRGLDFSVEQGEFISIVGSNGSGKTTLLNVIAGTVEADAGSVTLLGKDVSRMKEYKRARHIARVFQDPKMGTCPIMTVAENLAMATRKGRPYGLTTALKRRDKAKYADVLKTLEMGLESKLDVLAGQLSGGQRQALALLMATLSGPDLLLLDEHTAALDPRTSVHIMELTQRIVTERRITTLMVTHNLNFALGYGSRLVMLHSGKVLFDVKGEEKASQTIEGLIGKFQQAQGVVSDTMAFG